MKLAAGEIERIVREVLSRLDGAALRDSTTGTTSQQPVADGSPATVTFAQRLVTQADVEQRLAGAKAVRVPARAVVTPAARDYLRERGVTLLYGGAEKASATGGVRLALGIAETNCPTEELARLLTNQAIDVERLANADLPTVVRQLSDAVSRAGTLGLLVTDQVAAAACLANRQTCVRAAVAASVDEVESAIRQIGVNLLIVAPRGRSAYQLKQIVSRFCTGAPHACPEALR